MRGKSLRELRIRSNLTVRAMGEAVNRSAPAVVAYEKDDRVIPVDVLATWLDVCTATDAERLAILAEGHGKASAEENGANPGIGGGVP